MFKLTKILVLASMMTPAVAIAEANVVSTNDQTQQQSSQQIGDNHMSYRKIAKVTQGRGQHWVGDGFPVNNMFSYGDKDVSPFLLLDYAKPTNFEPTDVPRGVGLHPHRGFETVTIVYDGELQHKDTAGHSGKIGRGDVQWMTAAGGILHEERHSDEFTRNGGRLEMVQLWVNLPAKDKMSAPHYQELLATNMPIIKMADEQGTVRVIAGTFGNKKGNAKTFTPVELYDITLKDGVSLDIPVTDGFTAMLLVLDGKLDINDQHVKSGSLVKFARSGDMIKLKALSATKLLFMGGEPINEPVVGHGPFVMNTEDEVKQAYADLKAGKLQRSSNNS